jgi:hypothetical protein
MTLAFLVIIFPVLYRTITTGFPSDPTISGLTINNIWAEVARPKDNAAPVDAGLARFCFYYDMQERARWRQREVPLQEGSFGP